MRYVIPYSLSRDNFSTPVPLFTIAVLSLTKNLRSKCQFWKLFTVANLHHKITWQKQNNQVLPPPTQQVSFFGNWPHLLSPRFGSHKFKAFTVLFTFYLF